MVALVVRRVHSATALTSVDGEATGTGTPLAGLPLGVNPLATIRETLRALHTEPRPRLPPFTGGLIGYLGYGTVRCLERLPDTTVDTQRNLTPFILGQRGEIGVADAGAVAAWVQKTALTAMLVSSEEERTGVYGLPASEYWDCMRSGGQAQPQPASQFWIGRYDGFAAGRCGGHAAGDNHRGAARA